MYSFYGGRPGAAFVIVKTFPSIADMVAAFQQGSNYIDVHYDEYVLINTQDRNDKDNGKLYRRGYDFSNTMGGAEYIGRIVGPAGPAPNLIPTAYQHTTDPDDSPTAYIYSSETGQSEEKSLPGFTYNGYGIDIDTYIAEHEGEEDLPQQVLDNFGIDAFVSHYANVGSQTTISTIGALTTDNKGLVSGKEYKQIVWKSVSFTTPNGTASDAYITFRVPYPDYDFVAESVMNSQGASVENITSEQTINGQPATNYPFYKKLKINIPNVYPIDITNERWQGTGKIYDGPNTDNPYGTKRLAFTIPISDPLLDKITKIEVSGRMFVESFDVKENFTDAYFELESSVLKEVIFFKTMNAGDKLYLRSGISKDANDDIVFAEGAEVGEIASIRKTSLGVTVEVLTNLQSSNSQKTNFASIRFMNLYIRFYDAETLPNKDDGSKADVYGISNITNSAMYSNLLS